MAGLHFDITGDNDNLMRKLSETKRGVSDASNLIEKEGVSIESMFGRMAKGALAFGAGISAKEIVSNVMQIRGEFQKLEVSFNTMLGSEQKANDLMQQLVKTAATTPFDLQSVAGGAKQLLAYGDNVENVNEDLIRLGNIASGLSQPLNDIVYLYGTTMTQGRLYTADFNQFTGRGIPMIKELAKQFGVAESEVKGLVESGKVGFPEVQKVIQSLTNEGGMFFNLMEEQSKTIPGQISNIGDAIDSIYNNLGKQSEGVINDALSGVSYLVENYEAVGKTILELAATYGAYKAVLITISALQKLNLMVLQQAILEKKLAAKATVILSNSEAIAAAKTRLLTIAQGGLTKAIKSTTAAMFSNPYIIAAAAIAGVAFAIYKVVTAETEFDKANKRLNDTTTSVEKSLTSEASKLTSLERKLSEAKKGTEEYNSIKKTIVDNYGQYYKGLDGEIERVGNLSTVYGQLVEKMRLSIGQRKFESFFKAEQDNLDNTIGEKLDKAYDTLIEKYGKKKGSELYQQVFDYAIRGTSMSSDIWNQINGATFKEWGFDNSPVGFSIRSVSSLVLDMNQATRASSKVLDEFKEKYQMTEEEVSKILSGGKNAGNDDPVENKTLKQLLIDINSAENKLKSLQNQSKQGVISVDKVKEQTDALSKLTSQYRLMTGKEYGSVKEDDKTIKTKQKQSDLLLEISRNAKERENAERQVAFEIEQAKIDVMKDGFVKEQAQIELNHRKALQGITLRGEEMLKAQQEAERKQWEKDGKKGVFTPKTTSVSQLPTEQLQQLSGLMTGVVAKTNNDNQMLIDGMVKQYQTYAEKRKEIEKKFDDDIRSMQEKNTGGKYDANIVEAKKQKTEAIAELDSTVIANKSMWTRLFSDTSAMSKKQIKQILSEIKNLTDYLEGISVTVPVGFTQEQLEQLKKDPEKIKAIYDELIKKQDELDDRTNYPFSGIIKGFGKLKEAAELAHKATKATSEEERKILEYQAESAKAKGMDYIREGAVMASDSVSMLADKLKELAAATGDERFAESAEQFGALAQNFGAAAKGFQSGGWIGAIIGGATDMLTQTFQAITTAKAEVVEFENNRKDFLAEYNLLMLRSKIDSEDQDNVFGTSALKRASEAAKAAQDAMAQYTDEVTKRTVPEIKKEFKNLGAAIFGMNPFTSANFLGFGKSISNETKTLQAAFEKGYTDLQAMAVKTKDRSGWANFWGKKDEFTSLKDLAPQLWDKETGDFDIEAAKVFLDTNTQISDEQRKQIENVIDLKETYNDAMLVLKDDVADTFGSLGSGLMDSLVGAIQNGNIAMDKFADSVGKTFESLGKKIAQELFFQKEFDKLQEDLVKTYEMGDSEAIANAQMDIVSRFFDSIGGKMDEAEAWMEEWKKKAAEKGFTLWGEGESDWLGTTTDSIAQSILDGLEAGKSGISDFADDFESMMKKAVLNSIKIKYLEEPLKEFYKKFASFSESGGQLTEAEIAELRGMYGDIVDGAKAQFDGMKDIAGLDFTTDSDNSLKGAFAKASQESIGLLAGQTGASRKIQEEILNNMQPIREQMQFIYDLQKEGWQDVKAIRELTDKVEKNTERIADIAEKIDGSMSEIGKDTRRSADALDGGTINAKVKMQ